MMSLEAYIDNLDNMLNDPTREQSSPELEEEYRQLLIWLLELREWRSKARNTVYDRFQRMIGDGAL